MSSTNVENIHIRIKSELDRLDLSMAQAARMMGESDSQGLRDICGGRKRAPAELLAKLMGVPGVDMNFILTGHTAKSVLTAQQRLASYEAVTLTNDERDLLESYRKASDEGKAMLKAASEALVKKPVKRRGPSM